MSEDEENWDVDRFLEENQSRSDPDEFRDEMATRRLPEPEISRKWRYYYQDKIFKQQLLELEHEYQDSPTRRSNINSKVEKSIIEHLDNTEPILNLDKSSSLYQAIRTCHQPSDFENARKQGFFLGKKLEQKRQELSDNNENLNIEFPLHYSNTTSHKVKLNDQEGFWNNILGFINSEIYRYNLQEFASQFEEERGEIMSQLTNAKKDQVIRDYKLDLLSELPISERASKTLKTYDDISLVETYEEGLIEGLAYAERSES